MVTIVKRLIGALLALAGLALTVVGVWFATQLGTSGTAEFTARPDTTDPVLIRPDVLNRLDADVTVTATAAPGGTVWMALANPSDATALLGPARHVAVTGVSVQDWRLETTVRGSGPSSELGAADLWRQQDEGARTVRLTADQAEAPETLVVKSEGAPLRTVTFAVADKTWFVEAVVAALVGLFLLVTGVVLLWPRRHDDPAEGTSPEDPAVADSSFRPTGSGASTPAAGPTDPSTVPAADGADSERPARSEARGPLDPPEPAEPAEPRSPQEVSR
jgi:hypothetical protein